MTDVDTLLKYLRRISEKDQLAQRGSALSYQDIDEAIEAIEDLQRDLDKARNVARGFYEHVRDNCSVMLLGDAVKEHPWLEE
jgi:hypothetical protein